MWRPAVLLTLAVAGCAAHRAAGAPGATLDTVRTADGQEIGLEHYPGSGPPVLLCPGVASGPRSVDLDERHSLARWLAAQGRDVWILVHRGARSQAAQDFDTLWREDLSAAVAHVRARTGADVDLVGNSLGGMLIYAYLSQRGEGVSAAVTLGAPVRLDWGGFVDAGGSSLTELLIKPDSRVPVAEIGSALLPLHADLSGNPLQRLLYNPDNVTAESWKRFIEYGLYDLSGQILWFLVRMVHTGRFESIDGRIDYRAEMAKIRTPVLVVAAKLDRVAIVPGVKDAYRALGGPKEWLLLGEETTVEVDYGHVDMMLGERAPTELWPRILDFLNRHRRPRG